MKTTFFAASTLLLASAAHAETPVLQVYAPDYFASEWGPGPGIEAGFEAQCGCDLKFVTGDVLPRLLLEGERTEADVVIGLNTDVTARARASGLFAPHGQNTDDLTMPIDWTDDTFLPFDYSYTAFIYDNTKMDNAPTSFDALLALPDDTKIVIQDPRSSTPGLGLLMWVKEAYGDRAEQVWEGLADNIVTVTPGWSEAYGLFLEGEADLVLSYTTSPAYHLIAEEDDTKIALPFEEGHYLQVEVAGMLAGTDQPELARDFLQFITTDAFQSAIPETNWMYPAKTPESGLPAGFETLITPAKSLIFSPDEAAEIRDTALQTWLSALSQ